MAHKLILFPNGRREERRLEGRSVKLGRDSGNDIVISPADRSVSRFHARLEHDGRYWRVVDTNSTNRIRVNGELIEPGEAGARVLTDGDTVLLGSFPIRIVREETGSLVLGDDPGSGSPGASPTLVTRAPDLESVLKVPSAVRLPREAEEAIERAKKALTVLTTIGRRIAAVTPDDDIIDAIVDLVFEATPAERAALFLWDEDVAHLVPKRTRTREGGEATTMRVSESLVSQAFTQGAIVQMDPQVKPSTSMHNLRLLSAAAVPLLGESGALGVIYVDTPLVAAAFGPFDVALLSALASHTAIALEQARLLRNARHEERKRWKLEQYLAPGVVDRILASADNSPGFSMKAEEVDVTVLFCDMTGFTSRTEEMAPHDVLVLLNRCFSRMTETVQEHGGTVDKYIGDCLMAVFGAPFAQPDHARRAARAALGLRAAIHAVNSEGPEAEVGFRIGLHSGKAVAGDVGHVTRRNWTVLGATVNLASRMESSVARPGQIVLTGDTRAGLGDEFELRPVTVANPVKGIRRDFAAFELLGLHAGRDPMPEVDSGGRRGGS